MYVFARGTDYKSAPAGERILYILPKTTFRKKNTFQQILATYFSREKYLSTNTYYLLFARKVPFNKHLLPTFREKSTRQQTLATYFSQEKHLSTNTCHLFYSRKVVFNNFMASLRRSRSHFKDIAAPLQVGKLREI